MNYFEDLKLGERVVLGNYTFTAENIKTFARRRTCTYEFA